jgi:GAF domain-containing protein
LEKPAFPNDEKERQANLDSLEVLDTPAEERYDRITRIAWRALDIPIVLISLVDRDRQWFKSAQGLATLKTPREVSFCGHAILEDKALVVPDATRDERFTDNPLVIDGPRVRFDAGQPLAAPGGRKIGTLCVIDTKPRSFSSQDQEALRDLAALVENELRKHSLPYPHFFSQVRLLGPFCPQRDFPSAGAPFSLSAPVCRDAGVDSRLSMQYFGFISDRAP